MKKIIITLLLVWCMSLLLAAKPALTSDTPIKLPETIFSGYQGNHHVQGVAVDVKRGCVYFSFTTKLVKTDLNGLLLGSVEGLTGHLGCLTLNPEDGRIYGSLEYKDDIIGVGIAGDNAKKRKSAFYIAVFDGDSITRVGMGPDEPGVMTTVYLKDVVKDYYAKVKCGDQTTEHRYGCSGIDGVAFGPKPGVKDNRFILYVAYGIYGDTVRTDNDYQILLTYDVAEWKRYERQLTQDKPHTSGPSKPLCRYFVYTGNTEFGIQNLNYNPCANALMAAVYTGKKSSFPNFSLFCIDLDNPARRETLRGMAGNKKGLVLPLKKIGLLDEKTGVRGWKFRYGYTGICSVGDGLFYISHHSTRPEQSSTLNLYRWLGDMEVPFIKVEEENAK